MNQPAGGLGELVRRLRRVDSAEAVSLFCAAAALLAVWPVAILGRGLLLSIGVALLALLLVAFGVPLVLRTLATALIVVAIVVSATDGGLRIHVVGPLVFLAVATVSTVGKPSIRRLISLLVGAVGVGVVSLLLGGWVLNPLSPDASSSSSPEMPRDSSADGLWQRLLEFIGLGSGGDGAPGELNPSLPPPPADDRSLNWALILAVLALLLALGLLLRLLLRRRGQRGAMGSKWSLIERFERVGERAGAVREPSQGLVSYGEAFAGPADERPTVAGEAISAALFHPAVDDSSYAETLLSDLEGKPPTRRKPADDPKRDPGLSG